MNNRTLCPTSKFLWQPTPLSPPAVDVEFNRMNALQRSVESWRYTIMSLEYWLSPTGHLREWVRHNVRWAVWLLVPALLIFPAVNLVLDGVLSWTTMLTAIAHHLIIFPILAILAFIVLRIAWEIVKAFVSFKR